ncbi:uncharacterized protein LOC119732347 [Patiria miniata]|uniref:Uncharacterized protein n=1 Tax=Patiria miniata TaxID=46514 RepID=A0A914ADB7_PATMI|nr:uncharacterized protein LOC119732347 [Patiria miniata]
MAHKPIEIPAEVHIMRKKDEITRREIQDILKAVSAISNVQRRGTIKMKNLQSQGWTKKSGHENVTAKHLDQWKKIVSQEALRLLPQECMSIFEFCSNAQDAEFLYCHVTPAPRPITVEYKLHVPSVSGKRVVRDFDGALAVLLRTADDTWPGRGAKSPADKDYASVDGSSASSEANSTEPAEPTIRLRLTEVNAQGKGKGKDVPHEDRQLTEIIEGGISSHISALANKNGGSIIIEDADSVCQIVDGRIGEKDQDSIVNCLEECCKKKIWGRERVPPKRGEQWDVCFPIVNQDNILFTIRVYVFYGGVFEEEPVAYTLKQNADDSYEVVRMEFEDWYKAMVKQHEEKEQDYNDTEKRLEEIKAKGSNPHCVSNDNTSSEPHLLPTAEGGSFE